MIKENIKMKLKKYAVAGIVPEILDLKYLYLEIDSKISSQVSLSNIFLKLFIINFTKQYKK